MYKSSLFSIPLIAFVAFGFLDDSHSDLNEKGFCYNFNLHTIKVACVLVISYFLYLVWSYLWQYKFMYLTTSLSQPEGLKVF